MVARAAKGASENKLLPITSMMAIELKQNVLTLTTTDTANTLKIRADKIEGEDFYAVVPVDKFSKLIAKSTSEAITLTVKENSLEVKSNGTYNIDLMVDEEGLIKFPEYVFDKHGKGFIVNLTSIKSILAINKAAIAKNLESPCLCGYYVGDQVITTDENVICFQNINLVNEPILISPEMMELLALNTEEKIKYYHTGSYFLFETDNVIVHGAEHDGKEVFPVDEILGYLDQEFTSSCKLPKLLLQSIIDRLSLFIEPYDKNGAYFTFTKQGVKIYSKKSSSVETMAYSESRNFTPFTCVVDIPMIKSQIDANPAELIELHYGHNAAIKLVSGNITQVISLLEDDLAANSNSGSSES
jgi:hypothetical protein